MASERTKTYKRRIVIFKILSFISTILPLVVFIVMGFINGECGKSNKIFLSFTCLIAVMLTLINILYKYHLRSPMFILLLGIYKALNNVLTLIIIISIGIVLDEFIFTPAAKKAKEKWIINKEIDASNDT